MDLSLLAEAVCCFSSTEIAALMREERASLLSPVQFRNGVYPVVYQLIVSGRFRVLTQLLEMFPVKDWNEVQYEGVTVLEHCIQVNEKELPRLLSIATGLDLNHGSSEPPLSFAARHSKEPAFLELLHRGAQVPSLRHFDSIPLSPAMQFQLWHKAVYEGRLGFLWTWEKKRVCNGVPGSIVREIVTFIDDSLFHPE